MKMTGNLGRSACIAAALSMAMPTMAQTMSPATGSGQQLESNFPEGRSIPPNEAEQLRGGGKIKIAVVILRVGGRLMMRVINCTSSSACRNEAIRRFGGAAVRWIASGVAFDALARQACRSGFRIAC